MIRHFERELADDAGDYVTWMGFACQTGDGRRASRYTCLLYTSGTACSSRFIFSARHLGAQAGNEPFHQRHPVEGGHQVKACLLYTSTLQGHQGARSFPRNLGGTAVMYLQPSHGTLRGTAFCVPLHQIFGRTRCV